MQFKLSCSRKALLFALSFFGFFSSHLSAQGLEWLETIGAAQTDQGTVLARDHHDNLYFVGYYTGSVDLDPGPGVTLFPPFSSYADVFIQKLNPAHELIWAKRITGNKGNRTPETVAVDANDNVLVAGYFRSSITYQITTPDTLKAKGDTDIFVQKMDSAGNLLWIHSFGGTTSTFENAKGVTTDADGNVYLTGFFCGTTDFDPGPGVFTMTTLYQTAQAFVVKYDPEGNFMWAYTLTGTGSTLGQDIVLDPSGFVYVVGNMDYTIDFDPGPDTFNLTSTLITDAFIQKIDTAGHLVWARLIGSSGNDYAEQVKIDAQGDVFLVGSLGGVADFDPGPQVLNVSNGNYIFKMHASGAPVWVKSTAASVIANIDFDQFGHLYVGGYFGFTSDFDPGPDTFKVTSNGPIDAFLLKLDTAGQFNSVLHFGGTFQNYVKDMMVDAEGDVYLTGYYKNSTDFDPGPSFNPHTAIGVAADAYLVKINERWDFQGVVFNDLNANQIQDAGEPGLPGAIMQVKNDAYYATSGSAGDYHLYKNLVGDTLVPVLPHPYWSVSPAFALLDSAQTPQHFAIQIPPNIQDAAVFAVPQGTFRAGDETLIRVHAQNLATATIAPFRVVVRGDALLQTLQIVDATPALLVAAGDSLVWQLDALAPGTDSVLELRVKTAVSAPFGAPIALNLSVLDAQDADTTNNKAQLIDIVSAAFDPNDKQVYPKKVYSDALEQTRLQYLIRFQNTGNASARIVTLQDTLDTRLNGASLKILGASHPFSWRLRGANILEFNFSPIDLPDSTTNYAESQGYVAFSIDAPHALAGGDSLQNRAGIYFDYNAPVITNYATLQVLKAIVSTYLPATDTGLGMVLLPNPVAPFEPASIQLNFVADQISIYNVSGKLVHQFMPFDGVPTIQVPGLTSGAYWVNARNGKQSVTKLWMVMRP